MRRFVAENNVDVATEYSFIWMRWRRRLRRKGPELQAFARLAPTVEAPSLDLLVSPEYVVQKQRTAKFGGHRESPCR